MKKVIKKKNNRWYLISIFALIAFIILAIPFAFVIDFYFSGSFQTLDLSYNLMLLPFLISIMFVTILLWLFFRHKKRKIFYLFWGLCGIFLLLGFFTFWIPAYLVYFNNITKYDRAVNYCKHPLVYVNNFLGFYLAPGDFNYDPSPEGLFDEAYFCTVEQAKKAGYPSL